MIITGVAHRCRIIGDNRDRIRRAVVGTVIDNQLHGVCSRCIYAESGFNVYGAGKLRIAATGLGDDRPLKRQGISIRITGTISVELHRTIDPYHLIGSGITDRSRIVRGNLHCIRCTADSAVIDDQLEGITARNIDHHSRFFYFRVG